jgi:hypothetical protein
VQCNSDRHGGDTPLARPATAIVARSWPSRPDAPDLTRSVRTRSRIADAVRSADGTTVGVNRSLRPAIPRRSRAKTGQTLSDALIALVWAALFWAALRW